MAGQSWSQESNRFRILGCREQTITLCAQPPLTQRPWDDGICSGFRGFHKKTRAGGADAVAQALGAALRARAADGAPLGLMLHHAAMDDDERRALRDLLAAAASHPRLRWHPMRALLPTTPPAAPRAGTA